jgi:hypothetical protein
MRRNRPTPEAEAMPSDLKAAQCAISEHRPKACKARTNFPIRCRKFEWCPSHPLLSARFQGAEGLFGCESDRMTPTNSAQAWAATKIRK